MIINHCHRPLEKQELDIGQSPKRDSGSLMILKLYSRCVCMPVNVFVYIFLEKGFNGFHQIENPQ